MAAQVNDLRKIRRTKKRRRFFRKLLLVIIIFSLAGAAYITREKWLPMFEGVVDKYKETIINDGKLAEGNFPVKVSTSSQYGIVGFDSRFAVLTDTNFYTFEKNGTALFYNRPFNYIPYLNEFDDQKILFYLINHPQINFDMVNNLINHKEIISEEKFLKEKTIYKLEG